MVALSGAATLVTGASAGIGRETARALAREGANVALAARREARLEDLAAELEADHGVDAVPVPTDVSVAADAAAMVDRSVEAFGGLDVVVSNAGVTHLGGVDETTTDEYRQVMGVNVDGTFFTARAALPHLRETGGNLIFVGSFSGQYPRPGSSLYAASKWWVRGFAHSLAGTVGDEGVAVTVVNPSEVRTEIGEGYDLREVFDPGEVSEPETVAEAIVFAASQTPPDAVHELDLYRRDKFADF